MAADYLDRSTGRIEVAANALKGIAAQEDPVRGEQLDPIIEMLLGDAVR